MENAEQILHSLEVFRKRKAKSIPQELNDYITFVARTGDPVFQWTLVKCLFKEKLRSVLSEFYEITPSSDIPPCPNVDPFDYESMKNSLLERLDSFNAAPFTIQRFCELLISPLRLYNRVDKYMRAIETTILVVSTREPGPQHMVVENGEQGEALNGSDNNSDSNVDVEMEDVSWKETKDKLDEDKPCTSDQLESGCENDKEKDVTTPEAGISTTDQANEDQMQSEIPPTVPESDIPIPDISVNSDQPNIQSEATETEPSKEIKPEDSPNPFNEVVATDNKPEIETSPIVIPQIVIDTVHMTEERLSAEIDVTDETAAVNNDIEDKIETVTASPIQESNPSEIQLEVKSPISDPVTETPFESIELNNKAEDSPTPTANPDINPLEELQKMEDTTIIESKLQQTVQDIVLSEITDTKANEPEQKDTVENIVAGSEPSKETPQPPENQADVNVTDVIGADPVLNENGAETASSEVTDTTDTSS